MAISRDKLLKDLLPGLNDLFKYGADYLKQVDQVIANDAQAAREKEFIKQAGKTFRDAVKTAHIIENEKRLKEIEDAILNDRLQVVAKAGTMGGKTARVLRNEQKKKELEDAIQEQSR